MGLLNTDPAVRLNATFSPVYPPAGNVAMSTQSGALGLAILDYARRLNIGISSFVSVGNKADVSGNDLIQYWADDPRTDVILLYLESFGNPKKFSEIARRVGRTKPIVAVKAGRSAAGARAAASHTGALASSDTVVDALFRAGRRHPDRAARRAVRRGGAARAPAGAARPPRRDPDERRRSGHPRRRRLRGERPRAAGPVRDDARRAAVLPAGGGQRRQSGRHAGVGAAGALPARARRRSCATSRSTASSRSSFRRSSPSPTRSPRRSATRRRGGPGQAGARRVHARRGRARDARADSVATRFPNRRRSRLRGSRAYGRWRATPLGTTPVLAGHRRRSRSAQTVDVVLTRGGGWTTPDEGMALADRRRDRRAGRAGRHERRTTRLPRRGRWHTRSPSRRWARRCCTRPNAGRSR